MRWIGIISLRRLSVKLLLLVAVCLVCLLITAKFLKNPERGSPKNFDMQGDDDDGDNDDDDNDDDGNTDGEDNDIIPHMERLGPEPQWEVADILRRLPTVEKPVVPVIVVDEHHEVSKYWFDAVTTGILKKAGHTLLHIDGHSDSAPPRNPWKVPWFRLPRNHSEVANMMQTNDGFIAGAALAGLINRYIWVWPDWDRAEHKDEADHEIMDVKAGWRTYYPHKGKPFRRFCACEKPRTPPEGAKKEPEWSCWDDKPYASLMEGGPTVAVLQCEPQFTVVVEHVHESKAVELLKRGGWIKKDENIMLDIDEDYYGCESSVMPLLNSGLTLQDVYKLSTLIGQILCINDVRYEQVADSFFQAFLQIVEDIKNSNCEGDVTRKKMKCLSEIETDIALNQIIPVINSKLEKAGAQSQICDGQTLEPILKVLIRSLHTLNNTQFEAIRYVGVCIRSAPTSFMFQPNSLHLCHGFNVPGKSVVSVHVPTANENTARTGILKETLTLLPKQPSLVTVCRSMRDGYTPWSFFDSIERDVLKTLLSVFPDVTERSFHFDENLLGGQKGWPKRNRGFIHKD